MDGFFLHLSAEFFCGRVYSTNHFLRFRQDAELR
jgi:hypothetical protein